MRFMHLSVFVVLSFIIYSVFCLRLFMYLPSIISFSFHTLLVFFFVAFSVNDAFYISRFMQLLDCPFYVFSVGQMFCIFVACYFIYVFSVHHVSCLYRVMHCWNFRFMYFQYHLFSRFGFFAGCMATGHSAGVYEFG